MIFREETLLNVIRSVTRNGRSIILTAILALILVYMFSLVAFLFLKDDFLVETDPPPAIAQIGKLIIITLNIHSKYFLSFYYEKYLCIV